MRYIVRRATKGISPSDPWDGPAWSGANVAEVDKFHPQSGDHRPRTQAKALYDKRGIWVLFRVEDRYVRCTRTEYQAMVCNDSCVEFYLKPKPDKGYLNFEIGGGGAMLLYYIEDHARRPGGFAKFTPVDPTLGGTVLRRSSLSRLVEPEIEEPLTWTLCCFAPFAVLEHYIGPLGSIPGQVWRGNFFKCGDETSHPHWASWSPIGEELNFHEPKYFGEIVFE